MKAAISFPFLVAPPKDRFSSALKSILQNLISQHNSDVTVGPVIPAATTIKVTAAYHHVSGTAAIKNITAPPGFKGAIHLIPDGLFTTVTGGNIGLATTAVVGKIITLVFDGSKWWPSY